METKNANHRRGGSAFKQDDTRALAWRTLLQAKMDDLQRAVKLYRTMLTRGRERKYHELEVGGMRRVAGLYPCKPFREWGRLDTVPHSPGFGEAGFS